MPTTSCCLIWETLLGSSPDLVKWSRALLRRPLTWVLRPCVLKTPSLLKTLPQFFFPHLGLLPAPPLSPLPFLAARKVLERLLCLIWALGMSVPISFLNKATRTLTLPLRMTKLGGAQSGWVTCPRSTSRIGLDTQVIWRLLTSPSLSNFLPTEVSSSYLLTSAWWASPGRTLPCSSRSKCELRAGHLPSMVRGHIRMNVNSFSLPPNPSTPSSPTSPECDSPRCPHLHIPLPSNPSPASVLPPECSPCLPLLSIPYAIA